MRPLCAAILVIPSFGPAVPAAAFNSFTAFTSLEDTAGMNIVSDIDEDIFGTIYP
jgi:hypothetical protein